MNLLMLLAIVAALGWGVFAQRGRIRRAESRRPLAPSARLLNRGEQFEYTDGRRRFTGECAWAWKEVPGESPQRVYPIALIVESISRAGPGALAPMTQGKRMAVAVQAQRAFELAGVQAVVWSRDEGAEGAGHKAR